MLASDLSTTYARRFACREIAGAEVSFVAKASFRGLAELQAAFRQSSEVLPTLNWRPEENTISLPFGVQVKPKLDELSNVTCSGSPCGM
jgi:hypothetical protein